MAHAGNNRRRSEGRRKRCEDRAGEGPCKITALISIDQFDAATSL